MLLLSLLASLSTLREIAHAHGIVPIRHREARHNRTRIRGRMTSTSALWSLGGSVRELGYFYVPLKIGTPSRDFEVIVDTGSSMVYVSCSICGTKCGRHADEAYDPAGSSTYEHVGCRDERCACGSPSCVCKPQDQCFYTRNYAEGSSSEGVLVSDVVALGESRERVTFGCESKETGLIYQQQADGVMGLGRSDITLQKQLSRSGVIEDVFSLCFGGTGGGGAIIFGRSELEDALQFQYTQLQEGLLASGFYRVSVHDMLVGDRSMGISPSQWNRGMGTIVDSGTTFVYLDGSIYPAFEKLLKEATQQAGLHAVPGPDPSYSDTCYAGISGGKSALHKYFPRWTIKFADMEISLPPLNYLWMHGGIEDAYCLGVFNNHNGGTLLGGIFARDYLVQYDHMSNRLGFARVDCEALGEGIVRSPDGEGEGGKSAPATPALPPPSAPAPAPKETGPVGGRDPWIVLAFLLVVAGGLGAVALSVAAYSRWKRKRYIHLGWNDEAVEATALREDMEATLRASTELQPFQSTQ